MAGYIGSKAVLLSTTAAVVTGDADIGGGLTVDTNTLFVDAANNRVGVGTSSPATNFHVIGSARVGTQSGAGVDIGQNENGGEIGLNNSSSAQRGLIDFVDGNNDGNGTLRFLNLSPTDGDVLIGIAAANAAGNIMFLTDNTERARITSSGNVGIGVSSPDVGMHLRVFGNAFYTAQYGTGNKGLFGADATGAVVAASGAIPITFYTDNTERARFTGGGFFFFNNTGTFFPGLGNTDTGISFEPTGNGPSLFISRSDNIPFYLNRNTDGTSASFRRSGVDVGSISVTTTATAYNTSSDYRLKENVVPLSGAADRLAQIPVHRFNFIADPDKTVDGFLAHEVQAFVPECVTGTKDQVETVEVTDEDGNVTTETRPVYQGIDQSKLVPLLTAALQEALTKIDALEARIVTLEGGAA